MLPTISRDELKRLLDEDEPVTVVETLARHVYEHAHIPGAVNLPPDRVAELAPEVLPDKDAPIVVYCSSPT